MRYRYYVSRKLLRDTHAKHEGIRIPALELEKAVAVRLAEAVADPLRLAAELAIAPEPAQLQAAFVASERVSEKLRRRDHAVARGPIERIEIGEGVVRLLVDAAALAEQLALPAPTSDRPTLRLELPYRLSRRGQALRIVQTNGAPGAHTEYDQNLVNLLLTARRWWKRLESGSITIAQLAREERMSDSWITKVVRLNFLAPNLVGAILTGTQVGALTANNVTRFGTLPIEWSEQTRLFAAG